MPRQVSPLRALAFLFWLLPAAAAAHEPAPGGTYPAVMEPMPGDRVMGRADAPVTIVEYASLSCGHCARFHGEILPELERRRIGTGDVRLVYRDFPLDRLALVAAMVGRCAGDGAASLAVIDRIFRTQSRWKEAEQPLAALAAETAEFGMGPEAVRSCIVREDLAREIVSGAKLASERFDVGSTPTLFVQGRRLVGVHAFDEIDAILRPLLK